MRPRPRRNTQITASYRSGFECGAPQQPGHAAQQVAATRKERVGPLRHGRKPGNVGVNPPPSLPARRVAQDTVCRRGAGIDVGVGLDELDRVPEGVERDVGIVLRGVLVGAIDNACAGQTFPIGHPLLADSTIAVVDQRRAKVCALGGGRHGRTRPIRTVAASEQWYGILLFGRAFIQYPRAQRLDLRRATA